MSILDEILKELAGPHFGRLAHRKDVAMAYLNDEDPNVRIAAIRLCDRIWNCSDDPHFLDACRTIAAADPVVSVCVHAIDTLGRAFRATKNPGLSTYLVSIVKDDTRPDRVRKAAYFALREVQIGLTEMEMVIRQIATTKSALRELPTAVNEERAKRALLCGGRLPEDLWDSADQIDWSFVDTFA